MFESNRFSTAAPMTPQAWFQINASSIYRRVKMPMKLRRLMTNRWSPRSTGLTQTSNTFEQFNLRSDSKDPPTYFQSHFKATKYTTETPYSDQEYDWLIAESG